MSAKISVESAAGDKYRVTVEEGHSKTVHEVTVTPANLKHYGHGATAERLLEVSFRFLLQRESKESILPRFDLPVIETYFSDYPASMKKLLASA